MNRFSVATVAALIVGASSGPLVIAQNTTTISAPHAPASDQQLIDAAEKFETITEQAYTTSVGDLKSLIAQAERALFSIGAALPSETRTALHK